MCGVGGVVRADRDEPVADGALRRMAAALRHRGPDGYGLARGAGVGLVSTRLAIVDLVGGWQPMQARPGGPVLVYNGEVYNHLELAADLRREGVHLRTGTDTEVVLRLLERRGLEALPLLNGQFALAWWEPGPRRLTLVRDRFGVRPLHHALTAGGDLVFGSEPGALFASGEVSPAPDLHGLDDVFTTWGARAPRTVFRDVSQVRPGHAVVWQAGRVVHDAAWWSPDVGSRTDPAHQPLEPLLRDSVRLRLRADVDVGAYLSGGLDSSLLTALALQESDRPLRTFSVAFDDPRYDESPWQQQVAAALGTVHHVLRIGPRDIADGFRETVVHAATPLVRTAPVPMRLLARSAREHGITVVATGEGADELFLGYDVFKEVLARRRSVEHPAHAAALDALYPHLADRARGPGWRRALSAAGDAADPLFSHQPRAVATHAVTGALYREDVRQELDGVGSLDRLRAQLPLAFDGWDDVERATWLELTTLLEPYLLAAQGDRASMAHGVEGRYPFLDHRVFEHAMGLPRAERLSASADKVALRRLATRLLPPEVAARPKQPYRAPEVLPFFGVDAPAWVADALSPAALEATGVFDGQRAQGLVRRCRDGRVQGQREAMALVSVLSTQVWFEEHCGPGRVRHDEETSRPRVVLDLDETAWEVSA